MVAHAIPLPNEPNQSGQTDRRSAASTSGGQGPFSLVRERSVVVLPRDEPDVNLRERLAWTGGTPPYFKELKNDGQFL